MATSASTESSHVAATTRRWYWEVSWWVTSWNGNTATISYEVYDRCEDGASGSASVANYGFSGSIGGHDFSNVEGGNFVKDNRRAYGSFTHAGGTNIYITLTAHPFSGNYTSSLSVNHGLDNHASTPTVTCSATRTETTITVTMNVTNTGNLSLVDKYIDLFKNSNCSDASKIGTLSSINSNTSFSGSFGAPGTTPVLSPNTTYYIRANASNGAFRGYSSVISVTTYKYPYLTECSDFTIGNNVTLKFYNPLKRAIKIQMWAHNNSSFVTNLTDISAPSSVTNNIQTYTFNTSASSIVSNLYSAIPATTESKYNIDVYYPDKSGNKAVGDLGKKFKVKGNNQEAPTFTDFNYTDTDPLGSLLTGKNGVTWSGNQKGVLVAGLSDCIFKIPTSKKATSNYGATLDKYTFAWSNGPSTSTQYETNKEVSNHVYDGNTTTISVSAYDKRGQYKTVSKTVAIVTPSHATGTLNAPRKDGIDTETYLTGSIKIWAGDWKGGIDGSSNKRLNNLYKVEYSVNDGSKKDITSSITSITPTTSGDFKIYNLPAITSSNPIKIHQIGDSGGFPITNTYTIKIYVTTGPENVVGKQWDVQQLISTIKVNSANYGLTRFKVLNTNNNEYEHYYGINRLPFGRAGLIVRAEDIQIRAESSASGSTAIMGYGIGSGGVNRGVYDHTRGDWLFALKDIAYMSGQNNNNKSEAYYNDTLRAYVSDALWVCGTISTKLDTSTYLHGNKGINVMLNDENTSAGFHMIASQKSTNGRFMFGTWNDVFHLYYTAQSKIDSNENGFTYDFKLLSEGGNAEVPNNLYVKGNIKAGNLGTFKVGGWCYATCSSSGCSVVNGSNIASVSRENLGLYQVNFTNAMPNANYAISVSCEVGGRGGEITGVYAASTTSFRVDVTNYNGTAVEASQLRVMVLC